MILLVDNYDSFTYNLAQFINEFAEVDVIRNDALDLVERAEAASGIVLSPGPGRPKEAGQIETLIQSFSGKKPILGICLGHQAIGEVFGANVAQANEIRHGKISLMKRQESELFQGLPETFEIMRYHSLIVEKTSLNKQLQSLGQATDDQEMMAMKVVDKPIYGLQFHPESIGTPYGKLIIRNFVEITKRKVEA
ncbi:anthranilate synthase component II [Listeria fleischmannii 1991]|uniref:Anthranilate synthase component II n=2 Tax=Listeria fleischmannii TaxID=1069827 RepID=A0A2X3GT28_9LIST|nr:aminodeoxychorismate/anthranilate synthase component II [Listeria fleischmannii]EMG28965.1 anthranilate synthase component II [Listeria fleischmannii subsp. fleischmannii LU2006-1]KMT60759.1 anthranilate synthase component II [Listeria fleischmannii 1991]SQC65346.1 Anthranilate synthase component II [Listeria fleischmannii subsp. fleischmannii]